MRLAMNSSRPLHEAAGDGAEAMAASKKRKRSSLEHEMGVDAIAKKGKSCATCRRLKVKCDAGERERGGGSCSRCVRLGLQCLSEKKTWTSASGEEGPSDTQLAILKVERALQDVLSKLNMPALEQYGQTAIVEPFQQSGPIESATQDNLNGDDEVSPGPMNSLIEATRLNGLRSQLRSVKLRRKGGMRRMEADLVSENIISHTQADEMLDLFKTLLSHHLFSAGISPGATLNAIRTSSTVLFTSIMMVTALHVPGKEHLQEACHSRFLGLVSSAIFDRFHTLDDIRGLAVAAFWQPDLSWKLSGIAIRMATELNLHHAFHEAFHTDGLTDEARNECLEKARLWYLLYVLDHQSSVAYGRPPVMAELRPIKDYELMLRSPWCTAADRGLLARVAGCATLSRAFETFGLEPKRTMGADDGSILMHLRFTEDIRHWRDSWVRVHEQDTSAGDGLLRGIELHYHFSELVLNSLVLRGRGLEDLHELPTSLRPLALKAIQAATAILQHFIGNPTSRDGIVGMPLYLHSMIAFAAVFLMKLSPRWHTIGITINTAEQTVPLIEGVVKLLRSCRTGANHILYSMANGFERMLRQRGRRAEANGQWSSRPMEKPMPQDACIAVETGLSPEAGTGRTNGNVSSVADQPGTNAAVHNLQVDTPGAAPVGLDYPRSEFSDWEIQDAELWSMALGYDLLAPGGQAVQLMDVSQPMYASNDPSLWTPQ